MRVWRKDIETQESHSVVSWVLLYGGCAGWIGEFAFEFLRDAAAVIVGELGLALSEIGSEVVKCLQMSVCKW
jgi:hypothetical protein